MLQATVYNFEGKETDQIKLPDRLFNLPWNNDLVHQVVTALRANQRRSLADTKDRSEVRGGGKKPWRQKGTGRSRHGSSRSPIWVGGGVTHGPSADKDYSQKINKKMRTKAFLTILSKKLTDGEIVFVQDLPVAEAKTKLAQNYLNNLASAGFSKINYKKGRRALLAWPQVNELASRSFNNIPGTQVTNWQDLNSLDLLNYKYLVVVGPTDSLKVLQTRAKVG